MEIASKVKFDFRFEICDLNFPEIDVHIESNTLFMAFEVIMISK